MNNRFPFLLVITLTLFTFSVIAEQQTTTPTTHNSMQLIAIPLQQMTPTTLLPVHPHTQGTLAIDADPIPECYIINREVTP